MVQSVTLFGTAWLWMKITVWIVPKGLFDRNVKWLLCKKNIKSLLLVIRKLILMMCQPRISLIKKCYYLIKRKCLKACLRHQKLIEWIVTFIRSGLTFYLFCVLAASTWFSFEFASVPIHDACTWSCVLIPEINLNTILKIALKSCLQNLLFFFSQLHKEI